MQIKTEPCDWKDSPLYVAHNDDGNEIEVVGMNNFSKFIETRNKYFKADVVVSHKLWEVIAGKFNENHDEDMCWRNINRLYARGLEEMRMMVRAKLACNYIIFQYCPENKEVMNIVVEKLYDDTNGKRILIFMIAGQDEGDPEKV